MNDLLSFINTTMSLGHSVECYILSVCHFIVLRFGCVLYILHTVNAAAAAAADVTPLLLLLWLALLFFG